MIFDCHGLIFDLHPIWLYLVYNLVITKSGLFFTVYLLYRMFLGLLCFFAMKSGKLHPRNKAETQLFIGIDSCLVRQFVEMSPFLISIYATTLLFGNCHGLSRGRFQFFLLNLSLKTLEKKAHLLNYQTTPGLQRRGMLSRNGVQCMIKLLSCG